MAKTTNNTRTLTAAARREMFLKMKGSMKDDWKILKANTEETFYPYGFITLDYVLGLRGLAHGGRVVHIHGNEFAGKSTLCAGISRNYQRLTGEPISIFDFERTLTSEYLRKIGVDEDLALIYRPDCIEEAAKLFMEALNNGVRLFTFDSIPRMKAKVAMADVASGKAFKATVGKHARAIQDFYDVILPHAAEHDASLLMVNQTRARIEDTNEAAMAQKYPTFTNLPYTLPGGKANRFVTAVMLELQTKKAYRAGGLVDDPFIIEPGENKGNFVATEVRIRSLKNKVTGGGFREGRVWHRPGVGMDENIVVRQLARQYKLIDFQGRRYYAGKNIDEAIRVFDTKDQAIQELVIDQNQELLDKLRALLINTIEQDTSNQFNTEVDSALASYLKGEDNMEEGDETAAPAGGVKFDVEDLGD